MVENGLLNKECESERIGRREKIDSKAQFSKIMRPKLKKNGKVISLLRCRLEQIGLILTTRVNATPFKFYVFLHFLVQNRPCRQSTRTGLNGGSTQSQKRNSKEFKLRCWDAYKSYQILRWKWLRSMWDRAKRTLTTVNEGQNVGRQEHSEGSFQLGCSWHHFWINYWRERCSRAIDPETQICAQLRIEITPS